LIVALSIVTNCSVKTSFKVKYLADTCSHARELDYSFSMHSGWISPGKS